MLALIEPCEPMRAAATELEVGADEVHLDRDPRGWRLASLLDLR